MLNRGVRLRGERLLWSTPGLGFLKLKYQTSAVLSLRACHSVIVKVRNLKCFEEGAVADGRPAQCTKPHGLPRSGHFPQD